MKKQIEKLIELAHEYHAFAVEVNLPMHHNHVRTMYQNRFEWAKEGKTINIYLANEGQTWQVEFNDVKIVNYAKKVEMPFDATDEHLEFLYNDAHDYLHNYLYGIRDSMMLYAEQEKQKEIEKIELQLKKLKGLI